MPQLVYAELSVYFADEYEDSVRVTIGANSKLRRLMLQASSLQGSAAGKLQLTVLQPLLSYHVHFRGVEVKHNIG